MVNFTRSEFGSLIVVVATTKEEKKREEIYKSGMFSLLVNDVVCERDR